jgi:hypothetical protein
MAGEIQTRHCVRLIDIHGSNPSKSANGESCNGPTLVDAFIEIRHVVASASARFVFRKMTRRPVPTVLAFTSLELYRSRVSGGKTDTCNGSRAVLCLRIEIRPEFALRREKINNKSPWRRAPTRRRSGGGRLLSVDCGCQAHVIWRFSIAVNVQSQQPVLQYSR